jgi:hypothetical protein
LQVSCWRGSVALPLVKNSTLVFTP